MKIRRIDFSPGDWIGGTIELTLEEEGLYIRICALIWSRGSRITEDLLKAATREHGNKVNALLRCLEAKGKIVRNGPEISQKRAEKELENAEIRVRKAMENGAKGGRPNGLAKPNGLLIEQPILSPPTINHQKTPPTPRKKRGPRQGLENWHALPEDIAFAHSKGYNDRWIETAAPKFRDHHVARGNLFVDRSAAWRTWVQNAIQYDQARPKAAEIGGLSLGSADEGTWRRRLVDYKKSGFWMPNWGFPPKDPDCYAPSALLIEFGFQRETVDALPL